MAKPEIKFYNDDLIIDQRRNKKNLTEEEIKAFEEDIINKGYRRLIEGVFIKNNDKI